jgi:hypothetical protein
MRAVRLALNLCLAGLLTASPCWAQTPEQRKELAELKRELTGVTSMVRKKEFEEAKAVYDAADAKLTEIATAMQVEKNDRKLQGIDALIEKGRESLELAWAKAENRPAKIGPSFVDTVAPIIQGKCVNCHGGANPRGRLDLSSFAAWKRGGANGPVLVAGNANRSNLALRLVHTDQRRRMPQNGQPLPQDEIETIVKWINAGARFDGNSEDALLADLGKAGEPQIEVVIPKPTGTETVSFTRDIAPFMGNLCVRCHNTNQKRGGLSLETFYDMMKGGDSGRVVLPGNVEGSRLFRLTGGLELPRMPADNQVRITRKNYDDLKKWFEEGNTFDGDNPRTPLRQYANAALTAGDRFTTMSADDFLNYRRTRTEELWKKAVPNDAARFNESAEFLVYGNASADRLAQVDTWAQEQLKNLKQAFGAGSGLAWKGRLAIFVTSDRFGYDEFNQVNNGRRAAKEMVGHSVVSPTYEDAYICLQDVGDEATHEAGGLQVSLYEHLTAAYLQREGAKVPDWAVRGTGLAMAHSVQRDNSYLKDLDAIAADGIKTLLNPADLFADGTFSPALTGAIGYSLVKYMVGQGGLPKFGQFIQALRGGQSAAQAVRAVYSADLDALARGYLNSLGRSR